MANEQRLIDMEDALRRIEHAEHIMHSINGIKAVDFGALRQFFWTLKPVDAVEVVRCKDCRFSEYWESACARKCHTKNGTYETVGDYDFCSRGERND